MKKIIIFWTIIVAVLAVGGVLLFKGCRKAPATLASQNAAALAGQVWALQTNNADLTTQVSALTNAIETLQTENAALTNTVEALRAENLAFAGQVGTLQTNNVALLAENAALADQVGTLQTNKVLLTRLNEVLKEENAAISGQVGILKTNNAALALRVGELNARLTNVLAAAAATAAAQTNIIAPVISAGGIVDVDSHRANFTRPLVTFNTNGMVAGLPCLFNNESATERVVTIARGDGYKYTFALNPGASEIINLLPGEYSYAWTIGKDPENYPLAGQDTFKVDSRPVHAFRTLGKTFHGGLRFRGDR